MSEEAGRKSPLDHLYDWSVRDSFETFREAMSGAMLFPDKRQIRRYCLARALAGPAAAGLIAEFGVWRGHGVNLFAKGAPDREVWGFDSFEGLEEDWTGHAKGGQAGRFSLQGALPEVSDNVHLVKGWVQDTLPDWLAARPGTALAFAHMDLDTYSPTRFVLEALAPRLVPGSVLLFDELYGYPGWRHHEWRALSEVLAPERYRFLAFSTEAVGIEIISDTQGGAPWPRP
ncbi:TylF/MycF family methyltransferase [Roseivivax sp. GX 12232]|uniref:TylF/MycF/NovP-related O-methyltransferase n=1 Tax=Roseivivax sp. GX 12232 TaxID=2900547 RepID=UPI001E3B3376|nr:TylF/MycF/NovP-related O-methyltransferase [Roseivivax sp. GX 12232]MCE0506816.1 TylF/MycF family methyltransferase [Roseivivax sp. GX 12232]